MSVRKWLWVIFIFKNESIFKNKNFKLIYSLAVKKEKLNKKIITNIAWIIYLLIIEIQPTLHFMTLNLMKFRYYEQNPISLTQDGTKHL